MPSRLRIGRRLLTGLLVLLALGLAGYGGYGLWQWYRATHTEDVTITSQIITQSVDTPEETVPTEACRNYSVHADQPRKIQIPSVGIDACIQRVGIDQHNAMAVPDNIHLAGWYVGSAQPGQKGVSVISGHVLGRYADAVFKDLQDLAAGSNIRIEMGDGTWHEFTTLATHQYSVDETVKQQFRQVENVDSQLTLITCGGIYDRQTQSYDKRIVVRAELRRDH